MSIEELATLLGEQITAERAKAWAEGFEAGTDWVPETLDFPNPLPLNPYRQKVDA